MALGRGAQAGRAPDVGHLSDLPGRRVGKAFVQREQRGCGRGLEERRVLGRPREGKDRKKTG